ncbi:MAG TPA: TolC family protein [Candidatus Binataceae bacterium]|nr:TolC family protein [Candidatus Binataceae bacterium]
MVIRSGVSVVVILMLWCPRFARAEEITLDQATAIAYESNPDLAAAAAELTVAAGAIQQSNYFSQFNPAIDNDADYRKRKGESNSQDWRIHLSQELEIFGQRGLRKESARLGYQRSAEELNDQRRLLAAAVQMSFYEALRLRQQVTLLGELEALDGRLTKMAVERFDAGEIGQIELNLAEVRYGQSKLAVLDVREAYRLERSSLGRLLGGAVGAQPEPSGALRPDLTHADVAVLVANARANRPDLKAAQLEIARLETEATLNKRLALPNPSIGVFFGHEQNTERFVGGTVGLSIPIFNRRQAEDTAIAGRLAQARAKLRATELDIEREVRDAYGRYIEAVKALRISSDEMVAPAQQSFGLLEEAFKAGKMDLLTLSVAERQAFEARSSYLEAWFNCAAARVSLELAVGGSV